MKRICIASGVAIACLSTVVQAADLGAPGSIKDSYVDYAAPYNWSGLYGGGFVGGAHSI